MGDRHEEEFRRLWIRKCLIYTVVIRVMVIDATVLLTSSVIVSFISLIGSVVLYKMNRKAALEDRHDEIKQNVEALQLSLNVISEDYNRLNKKLENLTAMIMDLKESQRILMHNEILSKIKRAMHEGHITLEERNTIILMHDTYHNKLGGNGQLDAAMKDLMEIEADYQ